MIRLSLAASTGSGAEDSGRSYLLEADLISRSASFRFRRDGKDVTAPAEVGLHSLETDESFGGMAASLSLLVAHPYGEVLRHLVLPQDMLKVEAWGPGGWELLFHGFVGGLRWNRQATPEGFTYRFTVLLEGPHRILQQGWENWQGVLRASDAKVAGAGATLAQQISAENSNEAPEKIVARILEFAFGGIMTIESQGQKVGFGTYFDLASGADWKSDFGFQLFMGKQWWIQQSGPLLQLIGGLLEPEVHEFFAVPRDGKVRFVYRPKPFPGAPERKASGEVEAAPADDARWLALPLIRLGTGGAPGALSSNGMLSDHQRANAFHWAGSSVSAASGINFFEKVRIGFWAHRPHIAKYGYAARQIQTSLVGVEKDGNWWVRNARKITERVAYQDSPLPWLEQQTRHYPWLPSRVAGVHIGARVTDYSDGTPVSGYLVGVRHSLQATNEGFEAASILTLDRCLVGVDHDGYCEGVRRYCEGLEWEAYAHAADADAAVLTTKGPGGVPPAQPGVTTSRGWVTPVKGTVTSAFGVRAQPKAGASIDHKGVDIGAVAGTPVSSPVDGTVLFVGSRPGYGNVVEIKAVKDQTTHLLAHLESIWVAQGAMVTAGQPVAGVGSTGTSTGAHLHWEVRDPQGRPVNPLGA